MVHESNNRPTTTQIVISSAGYVTTPQLLLFLAHRVRDGEGSDGDEEDEQHLRRRRHDRDSGMTEDRGSAKPVSHRQQQQQQPLGSAAAAAAAVTAATRRAGANPLNNNTNSHNSPTGNHEIKAENRDGHTSSDASWERGRERQRGGDRREGRGPKGQTDSEEDQEMEGERSDGGSAPAGGVSHGEPAPEHAPKARSKASPVHTGGGDAGNGGRPEVSAGMRFDRSGKSRAV